MGPRGVGLHRLVKLENTRPRRRAAEWVVEGMFGLYRFVIAADPAASSGPFRPGCPQGVNKMAVLSKRFGCGKPHPGRLLLIDDPAVPTVLPAEGFTPLRFRILRSECWLP